MKCLHSCLKVFNVNKDSFRTLNSQDLECVDEIAHGFSASIAYSALNINVDVTSGSSPTSPRHNIYISLRESQNILEYSRLEYVIVTQ